MHIQDLKRQAQENAQVSIEAQGPRGAFNATESGGYTQANELHVWGVQGDPEGQYQFIFLRIPDGTPHGKHEIVPEGERGVHAVFGTEEGTAYATQGDITLAYEGNNLKGASFVYQGVFENDTPYFISNGTLSISWGL
ncbi:hypothetical protein [Pseudomonas sp. DC3000-4b1]|uniref:hypothetical protein n=1 Tax=unclassified Pseudomonas TaxID=196821 RepID=UPI003CED47B6